MVQNIIKLIKNHLTTLKSQFISNVRLYSSGLKGEKASLVIAAQDEALNTCYYQSNIMEQPSDSKFRMCYKAEEHITHIVAGCTTVAPSDYSERVRLQVTDKYCEHIPGIVINVNGTTVMWDVPVITDRTILANQPHTVLHNKEVKTHTDLYSYTDDSNINTKKTEKQSKYKTWRLRSAGCGE